MIEIKGKFNTALVYATTVEEVALEQIQAVCDTQAFEHCKIRIMPDVHAGKGCTIGTTMTITDKIVPSMVGVDIGCGMYTVYLGKVDIDFAKLDKIVHTIPCGRNVWEGRVEKFDLTQLRCFRNLRDTKRLERSLGTLGGGNHFIEVDEDEFGTPCPSSPMPLSTSWSRRQRPSFPVWASISVPLSWPPRTALHPWPEPMTSRFKFLP